MRPPFYNRQQELRQLDRHWASGRAELFVLTGRRRVGKSRLLTHFFADKPHLIAVGTAQTQAIQLADLSRALARATGDPLLASQTLDSWGAVLTYLGQLARTRRFAIVLDEFSYYVDQAPELPSLLQRWWDQTGQQTAAMVVLTSSHGSFMDRLLAGDQPLFGRRTGALQLRPFDYADASHFFPNLAPVDQLRAYAIFGGMPAYLAAYNPSRTLRENLLERVLAEDAPLRHEPLYLLAQERSISQPAGYLSILRAIADGQTQPHLIAQAAGFRAPADIAPYLERLLAFGLIERLVPVTAPPTSRLSRYLIVDPFLAFWFQVVQPAAELLERGLGELVLEELMSGPEGLDRFLSRPQGPWERACGQYLWRCLRTGRLGDVRFDRLGPWWEGRGATESAEIDLVGRWREATTLIASCKWRNEYLKPGDLLDLRRVAGRAGASPATPAVLFSRSGFDPNLTAQAATESLWLVTPTEMLALQSS